MFSEEKLSKQGKKQNTGIKSFYSNTSYGLGFTKKCISKLSIKIFIKKKNRAGKTHAYRMLLSFNI